MIDTSLFKDDVDSILEWIEQEYKVRFSEYFNGVRDLYKRLQSESRPITDDELSRILINLPMTMFDVSEKLNELKVATEVMKLKLKEMEADLISKSAAKTATAKKAEAELKLTEPKILYEIYRTLIQRVENELAFAKELIMGAKKIWDGRRKTEQIMPVDINNLPEYEAR
jgi:hypothetical protein